PLAPGPAVQGAGRRRPLAFDELAAGVGDVRSGAGRRPGHEVVGVEPDAGPGRRDGAPGVEEVHRVRRQLDPRLLPALPAPGPPHGLAGGGRMQAGIGGLDTTAGKRPETSKKREVGSSSDPEQLELARVGPAYEEDDRGDPGRHAEDFGVTRWRIVHTIIGS